MNIVLSGRPPRYVGVVADRDFPAVTKGRRIIRQAWLRFGQNYRISLAAARILLIAETLSGSLADSRASSVYPAQWLMLAWSICVALELGLPRMSWRQAVRLQPMFGALDWGIIGALIVIHPVISPAFIILVPLLAVANHLPHNAKVIVIVGLLCLAALVGVSIRPFGSAAIGPPWLLMPAVLLVAALALANWIAHQAWRARFSKWSDHLTIAAVSAGEGVGDTTMSCLRGAYGSQDVVWLGHRNTEENLETMPLTRSGFDSSGSGSSFDTHSLATELAGSAAFAYERGCSSTVHISARGVVREADTPILAEAIAADVPEQRFVSGGVIRLEHGLIVFLVPCRHAPSRALLEETLERTLVVITAFDRFTQQEIWEAQNFLSARKAVSRDLHDTVLQTLASLRMRISTLLAKAGTSDPATIRRGLEDVQAIVSDEQRTLREVIEGAQRDASLDRNLNDVIAQTVKTLSAQWDVDCAFAPLDRSVVVDEHTSNQCNQIVREVVSNAVRHGRASQFSVAASIDGDTLMIAVRDDSATGHPDIAFDRGISSKSVAQRLAYVGGSAYVDRAETGSIFAIRIPLTEGQHG